MPVLAHPRFHGWRIVAFCGISQFMAMGFSIYLLSLYIEPMAATFNVSPGLIGSGMGLFYLVTSLSGPLVGSWVDRGHMRTVIMGGTVIFALSFVAMALATSVWHVALAMLVCTVVPGPLGGLIYSLYGSYTTSFWLLWVALPVALLCTWMLPRQGIAARQPAIA